MCPRVDVGQTARNGYAMLEKFGLRGARRVVRVARRVLDVVDPPHVPPLLGDRDIEWGYVAARLGAYVRPGDRVLDFGCGVGVLSLAAASLGARTLAIDLLPRSFLFEHPGIEFRQVDLLSLDEPGGSMRVIINCSTVEHVGLAGRYGSAERPDGDLEAMKRMRELLAPDGAMLLTIPVGQDGVFRPFHRTYGPERLPRLLEGFREVDAAYWSKRDGRWAPTTLERAQQVPCSERLYALGCMVLAPA